MCLSRLSDSNLADCSTAERTGVASREGGGSQLSHTGTMTSSTAQKQTKRKFKKIFEAQRSNNELNIAHQLFICSSCNAFIHTVDQNAGKTAMQPFHAFASLKSKSNVSTFTQKGTQLCNTLSWDTLCLSHTITFSFSTVVQFEIRKDVTKGWKKTTGKVSISAKTRANFVLYSCQANY